MNNFIKKTDMNWDPQQPVAGFEASDAAGDRWRDLKARRAVLVSST